MYIIPALLSLAAVAAARLGNSIVVNTSPDPFYLWVVPDAEGAPIGNRIEVVAGTHPGSNARDTRCANMVAHTAGGAWTEPLHVGHFAASNTTTGVAIKISKEIEGLYTSAPLQILAYTLAGDRVWCVLDSYPTPHLTSPHLTPKHPIHSTTLRGYRRARGKTWQRRDTDGVYLRRYNLDAVNGAPFQGQDVRVSSEGSETIEWAHGEDAGDVTRDNASDKDIVLIISGKV